MSSTRKQQGIGASQSTSGLGAGLPGEGVGNGFGAGLGSGSDAFGTTGASPVVSGDSSTFGAGGRSLPPASGVLHEVKRQATTRVNEQKARAAEGLGSVASAIKQATEHLRTENQTLAAYADTAVDQIQVFADRMRDKDPAEMIDDLERFARRNPTAFVGGAFLLGLGLARFLKSSDSRERSAYADAVDDGRNFGTSRSLSGAVGYTTGDLARPDDLSRAKGLTVDPSPGITS